MKEKYIIILDTESTMKQKVFDVGVVVANTHGKIIYKKAWIIKNNFTTQLFFEDKRTLYLNRLLNDNYPMSYNTPQEVIDDLTDIIVQYNIKEVYAYNASFDKRMIEQLANDFNLTNPMKDLKFICLWYLSAQSFMQKKEFKDYCIKNKFTTEKNNYKTSAEVAYSFIKKLPQFSEEHTALEDCIVEYEIYLECKNYHIPIDKGLCSNPWIIVQDIEQIKKLPKQFQTMRINIDNRLESIEKRLKQLDIDIKVITEKEDKKNN